MINPPYAYARTREEGAISVWNISHTHTLEISSLSSLMRVLSCNNRHLICDCILPEASLYPP